MLNLNVLNDYLKDEGYGFTVSEREIIKNNGVYNGLEIISYAESDLVPVFYPSEEFKEMTLEKQADYLKNLLEQSDNENAIDIEAFLNKDYILENVYPIVNGANNLKLYEECGLVCDNFLDMVVIYAIPVKENEEYVATAKVSKTLLEELNISKDELTAAAHKNINDYRIDNLLGMRIGRFKNRNNHGAAVVLNKKFLEDAYEQIGEYYLLPSSIHEVIILPKDEMTIEFESEGQRLVRLGNMVKTINETVVDSRDVLTDTVYYYNGEELACAYYNYED